MWRLDGLRAMLNRPAVPGNTEEIVGYIRKMILEYEDEVSRLREENRRQRKLLDAVWSPRVRLDRAEVLQHPASREEVPPSLAREEPETPHMKVKEELEEVWISREGEGLLEPEEADGTRCPSSAAPVKREDDGEHAPSSRLDRTEAEPLAWASEPYIKPEPQSPLSCASGKYTHVKEDPGEENCAGSEEPLGGVVPAGDSKAGIGRAKFIEKLFRCSVCELECVSKAHLRTHMRVHTGERPYACSVCGKAYTTKGCLNRHHQSIHCGDRPFHCKFCAFSFTVKSGLDRHLRVHTGERPYACSFCGLRFSQSGNLTKHINVHHRITSLKCKIKA